MYIADDESQVFQNIFSNILEMYNINKIAARTKHLKNSISLKDLEMKNQEMEKIN